jgi:hypothetical protein
MTRFILAAAVMALFSGSGISYAGCLDEAVDSFKVVLDDIYEEMGRPEMTHEVAKKMDERILKRGFDKRPAFTKNASFSWSPYKDSLTAVITCMEDSSSERVIWRPDQELETIDMDAVLEE